ncbi:hypothetical protein GCM10007973_18230 [Polymorphobacter multimanifer]|uniref:Uncharacterized protein n=1 Tax=Polymorphobacter multimanifer TaxID=1070431 RepID=A0A841LH98_9SPHN|nr:hypothetical protein [Polymorphobacter multimanifer]MBB6228338.1 hypothetical protein [Polymorphobacter multimanifer]GGI82124.1 hypothetical protein GCM10007973_18230 [Polymorphobacter multimanifer]
MSSFVRTIQRTVKRKSKGTGGPVHYLGRGSKLGVLNPKAMDLLARQAREKLREARNQ